MKRALLEIQHVRNSSLYLKILRYEPVNLKDIETIALLNGVADGINDKWVTIRAWTVQNKKEPSIFLKIESKHRQVISSKFLKSFKGAHNLMAFYEFFFMIFRLSKVHRG